MAIFTNKRDREGVPLLVQVAQVDTYNDQEIEHILRLVYGGDRYGDYIDDPVAACRMAGEGLRSLATKKSIPGRVLDWLNRYHSQGVRQWGLPYSQDDKYFNQFDHLEGDGDISIDRLLYEPVDPAYEEPFFDGYIADALQEVITEIWRSVKRGGDISLIVSLCPECENPMLYPSDSHIYCSRRCADRVGARRRKKLRTKIAHAPCDYGIIPVKL